MKYIELIWEVETLQAAACINSKSKCTCVLPETLSEYELIKLYKKLSSTKLLATKQEALTPNKEYAIYNILEDYIAIIKILDKVWCIFDYLEGLPLPMRVEEFDKLATTQFIFLGEV